jgi:hypothetical protein
MIKQKDIDKQIAKQRFKEGQRLKLLHRKDMNQEKIVKDDGKQFKRFRE